MPSEKEPNEKTVFTNVIVEGMNRGVITEEQVVALDGIRREQTRQAKLGDPLE